MNEVIDATGRYAIVVFCKEKTRVELYDSEEEYADAYVGYCEGEFNNVSELNDHIATVRVGYVDDY